VEAESHLVRGGNCVVQSCAVWEQIEVVRGGGASRQGEFGERGLSRSEDSNNSPLSLMVTMTLFGYMAPRVQGDVYFTDVHEIIALTNLPPFHHMQRPFIVKKHSALGNTFPIVVGFRVSA